MSLINNMLKDLEQRKKENGSNSSLPLDGLQPPDDGGEKASSKRRPPYRKWLLILLIIVLLIFVVSLYFSNKKSKQQRIDKAVQTMKTVPEAKKEPVAKNNLKAVQAKLVKKTAAQVKAHLEAASESAKAILQPKLLAVTPKQNQSELDFSLIVSQMPTYHVVTHATEQQVSLVLEGAQLSAKLPSLAKDNLVTGLSAQEQGNALELNFNLQQDVALLSIKHTPEKNGDDQLLLTFGRKVALQKTAEQTAEPVVIEKVPVKQTPEQQREQAYQQAIGALSDNDVTTAIAQLQRLVRQYPNYLQARTSLIKLYLRDGAFEQAQEELNVALSQSPRNIVLIELQARQDFLKGNYKEALKSLQSVPAPELKSNPTYYALIAALQQHLGHPMFAAQLYQQLLSVNPDNSTWWMGLGIAYEAANRPNSAVDAYKKALSTGGLNPNLHAFVATRMTELSD